MEKQFTLDKSNAKLLGVCAGFAAMSGTDVLMVRLAVIGLGLLIGPVALLLYCLIAWVAPNLD